MLAFGHPIQILHLPVDCRQLVCSIGAEQRSVGVSRFEIYQETFLIVGQGLAEFDDQSLPRVQKFVEANRKRQFIELHITGDGRRKFLNC